PAKPVVKFGDRVEKGQLIAAAGKGLSANVHASVSGLVTEVNDKHVKIKRG
ncbi:MAG: NADH-quinone oxidoreductase subunit J, partial [Clostridia bacterium]|nr:NADH-quinone oxidoreductase subunit J [Clostridia bacterium]